MSELINILSLGAGVQSSMLALAASKGEIGPKPVCAIFADTLAEPIAVYNWLRWLEKEITFPLIRVSKGSLKHDSLLIKLSGKSGKLYLKGLIPARTLNPDGTHGLLGRKCTADYKVEQIVREARKHCDWKRGEKRTLVSMWIGISADESARVKPSRHQFIENRWPLLEIGMSRSDCLSWMKKQGYPEPPRSACTFCPFHSDSEWLRLKKESPKEFAAVVRYEKDLQKAQRNQEALRGIPFLHDSCVPIDRVKFNANEKGLPSFTAECEGMCGV